MGTAESQRDSQICWPSFRSVAGSVQAWYSGARDSFFPSFLLQPQPPSRIYTHTLSIKHWAEFIVDKETKYMLLEMWNSKNGIPHCTHKLRIWPLIKFQKRCSQKSCTSVWKCVHFVCGSSRWFSKPQPLDWPPGNQAWHCVFLLYSVFRSKETTSLDWRRAAWPWNEYHVFDFPFLYFPFFFFFFFKESVRAQEEIFLE